MSESENKDIEYYKKVLEEERYKNVLLSSKLAGAVAEVNAKEAQIKRIKNNPMWKASKPLRSCMHFAIRQKDRIKNQGGLKGMARKLSSKKVELRARKQHGTLSFPNEEQAKKQSERVFDKDVTFSILVPLYNTPLNYLDDMIKSVINQTYQTCFIHIVIIIYLNKRLIARINIRSHAISPPFIRLTPANIRIILHKKNLVNHMTRFFKKVPLDKTASTIYNTIDNGQRRVSAKR